MGWETKFSVQLALLGAGLVISMPLVAAALGAGSIALMAWLRDFTEDHFVREVTGYIGLALALLQVVFSARKRLEWNFPGPSFAAWRGFHILAGVAFLFVVVFHTGGRLGWNLNGWLQSVFLVTVFIGLLGKVWESRLFTRAFAVAPGRATAALSTSAGHAEKPPAPPAASAGARAAQVRSAVNRARGIWLSLHIVLTAAFMSLLGFHVFSVYYF
jgi:hypothetical protein